GDLGDSAALEKAVAGVETVYHLAGLLPGATWHDLQRVNVRGTEQILHACCLAGSVHRFVFTSSVAVYEGAFHPDDWPLAETPRLGPCGSNQLRDYGRSKIAAERLVRHAAREHCLEIVILRPSTCYGVGSP